jgi:uncharacterized protein
VPSSDLRDNLRNSYLIWMRALRFFAWPIIAVSVLAAAGSVYYTWNHLKIDTDRNALVSSNKHLFKLSDKMNRAFGGRDGLVVVVENNRPEQTVKFADALAAELRHDPHRFPGLFYRLDPKTFKPWALLYLDKDDLLKISRNLTDQQPLLTRLAADPGLATFYRGVNEQMAGAMIGHLFTGFLGDQKKEALPDVTLLNGSLKQLLRGLQGNKSYVSPFNALFPKELSDLSQQGYFFTENDKFLLFLVTPQPDGYTTTNLDLAQLRKVVNRVEARFPGTEAGVTGPDALESDEMASSLADISMATWLSLLGQLALLVLFLRSLRRPLVEILALIIGLCWTFGLVTLVVGRLNLLSMIFAPLMLGLTIDFGIHWFCRLEEEQAGGGPCTYETLACTQQYSTPGIVYAGVAAAISFLPLIFMGFQGLAELGLILTMGMVVMLVATLVLVPAMVRICEGCIYGGATGECPPSPQPFLHLHWKQPWIIVILGLIIVALGGVALMHVPFDLNPLHLQNQKVESVQWEYRLIQDSKYSTSYGAVATSSLPELQARIEALKELPTVSHVESILSFLPHKVKSKQEMLQGLRPILDSIRFARGPASPSRPEELAAILSRINFKMGEAARSLEEEKSATTGQIAETHTLINRIIPLLDPAKNPRAASLLASLEGRFCGDLRDKWGLLRGFLNSALKTPGPTLMDLPQQVRERFISPNGTFLIRVFPSQDIWNFQPLKLFVKSLRSVDPNAVGDPVLLYVFTLGFRNACLKAAGLALLAIAAMLLILFRSWKITLLAFLPLIVGTGLTLNLMWLLGISFNQANVLFVPLILGEGIEFGIIILMRWRLEASARAITLPASTAKGVALSALTTTVGFGSLMVSGHRGVYSLGLLATVGSLCVLLASLSFLPAFIRVLERDYEPRPSFRPSLGLVRWFNHMIRRKRREKTALDL